MLKISMDMTELQNSFMEMGIFKKKVLFFAGMDSIYTSFRQVWQAMKAVG
jgi:hypothetical protein